MKTIGIIGGMGPLATADLFRCIIDNTQADCDQAHIPILIDNNTAIADRTAYILHGGEDPRTQLILSARRLEAAKADFLLIACNTAHYFYQDIASGIGIPLLHMPLLTAAYVREQGYRRVALLATDGTLQTGIYTDAFRAYDVEAILPQGEHQQAVMGLIYDGVKAGDAQYDTATFRAALTALLNKGAEAFVLGCTELPVAFIQYQLPGNTINPTEVLAKAAILQAGAQVRISK